MMESICAKTFDAECHNLSPYWGTRGIAWGHMAGIPLLALLGIIRSWAGRGGKRIDVTSATLRLD
jgi:hypothetical protein